MRNIKTRNELPKLKVEITTGQGAIAAKQAASWHRLWERLLSQSKAKSEIRND